MHNQKLQAGLLQWVLLFWQPIGLYLIVNDPTFSIELKFLGVIINTTFFLYILALSLHQPMNILNWGVGALLLCWYIYYTPIDLHNPGYDPFWKFIYVSIDIMSLIYLVGSMGSMFMQYKKWNINIKFVWYIDVVKRLIIG